MIIKWLSLKLLSLPDYLSVRINIQSWSIETIWLVDIKVWLRFLLTTYLFIHYKLRSLSICSLISIHLWSLNLKSALFLHLVLLILDIILDHELLVPHWLLKSVIYGSIFQNLLFIYWFDLRLKFTLIIHNTRFKSLICLRSINGHLINI